MSRAIFAALFSVGCFCAAIMQVQSPVVTWDGTSAKIEWQKPGAPWRDTIVFTTTSSPKFCEPYMTVKADGTVEQCI